MLIIDLDGVIRRWEPVAPIEARHGLPDGALFGTAFAPGLLDPAITGAIDDAHWRAAIADRLTARYGPAGRRVVAEWSRSSGTVDAAVFARVCAELDAAPGDCRFVDDTAGHAEAAGRAGLRAHHFRGPEGLALFLGSG